MTGAWHPRDCGGISTGGSWTACRKTGSGLRRHRKPSIGSANDALSVSTEVRVSRNVMNEWVSQGRRWFDVIVRLPDGHQSNRLFRTASFPARNPRKAPAFSAGTLFYDGSDWRLSKTCAAPPRGGTSRRLPPRVPSPLRGSVTRGYGSKAPSGLPEGRQHNGRVAPLKNAALRALENTPTPGGATPGG
jgi:hypothetical protein